MRWKIFNGALRITAINISYFSFEELVRSLTSFCETKETSSRYLKFISSLGNLQEAITINKDREGSIISW